MQGRLFTVMFYLVVISLSTNAFAVAPDTNTENILPINLSFSKSTDTELTGITIIEHPENVIIRTGESEQALTIRTVMSSDRKKTILIWDSKGNTNAVDLTFSAVYRGNNKDKLNIKTTLFEKSNTLTQERNYLYDQKIIDTLKTYKQSNNKNQLMASLQSIKNEVLSNKKSLPTTKKNQPMIAQTDIYTSETTYYSATSSSLSTTTFTTCPKPDINDDCYVSYYPEMDQYIYQYLSGQVSEDCLRKAITIWDNSNPDKSGNGCLDDQELIDYILVWMDNMVGDACILHAIIIWLDNCIMCTPSLYSYVEYESNSGIDISPKYIDLRFINEYDYRTPFNKIIYHSFKWQPLDLYMLKGRANTYPVPQYYSKEFVLNIKSDKDVYDYCKPLSSTGNKTYGFDTNLPEPNDFGSEESHFNRCGIFPGYIPGISDNEEIEIASKVDKIYPLGPDRLHEGDGVYKVLINIKSKTNQNATIISKGEVGNHITYFGAPCIGETITNSAKYP